MPYVFHKLPCWVPMALACTLAGCCHEDGTVCKDDIHLISGEINEEGNISLHFDLNTQYQGDLYVEMQPEGDEVNVFLYTRPAGRTSGKLL